MLLLSREVANSNFIVFGLTQPLSHMYSIVKWEYYFAFLHIGKDKYFDI